MPNSDFTGGNVVFDVAPPADTKLDIFRQISLSRTIDYQPTHRIDPEDLNTDFNFLLSAFQDLHSVNIDLMEWTNIHDDVKSYLKLFAANLDSYILLCQAPDEFLLCWIHQQLDILS